jgi:periplasmic protein TonB
MKLNSILATITILCALATTALGQSPTPSPSPAETPQVQPRPTKLRVSQGVAEQNLIHRVQPVYPLEALQKRISGVVLLGATIAGTGDVENLHVISGDPILAQASLDAVKKWKYKPYMYKGEPVKVETTVKIVFHLHL